MSGTLKASFHDSRHFYLCDPVGIRTRDPQLRRLLLYPAELPDHQIGCKIKQKLGDSQILYFKSYIGPVIKGILPLHKRLAGKKGVDVQRVVLSLFVKSSLTLSKGGAQEGIAVGGKDKLMGLEVEGEDGYVLLSNRETVNHGESDVLSFHAVDDILEDIVTCRVVGQ